MYPQCVIEVFDINQIFTQIYENPNQYGFAQDKLTQPYKTSADFKMLLNGTSPAQGYMFWDDIHPSADTHAILGKEFYKKYSEQYQFTEPNSEEVEEQIDLSNENLVAEQPSYVCFLWF